MVDSAASLPELDDPRIKPRGDGSAGAQQPGRRHPFSFTGKADEYFRIWIVNVALTIVTLGIYSAWAKVRTKQYFYRNTWVAGQSFDYLASPKRILRSRIIVVAAIGCVALAAQVSLALYGLLLLALIAATPWLLVKAAAFNARNSAYRNLRFSFSGKAGQAFEIYAGVTLAYLVSCGIAYPYAQWRMTKFIVQNSGYGKRKARWSASVSDYFGAYVVAALLSIPVYGVLVLTMALAAPSEGEPSEAATGAATLLGGALFYLLALIPAAYAKSQIANALYGGLHFGGHRLRSNQAFGDLAKLYLTNALALVATLGLAAPWARIRLARYRAERLALESAGGLDFEADVAHSDPAAIGDAALDLGDFDFDLV
jgi:uncharacterized membrane protein YjgN (DUF898 family)